jgi:hypothetical protein
LELRKKLMGAAAKQYLTEKPYKERGQTLRNAVTFDLIGINKACRGAQPDWEAAQRYYNELVDDVQAFVNLCQSSQGL